MTTAKDVLQRIKDEDISMSICVSPIRVASGSM